MRRPNPHGTPHRIAAALLIAALVSPAASLAQEEEGEAAEDEAVEAVPAEEDWTEGAMRGLDVAVDVAVVRPLAAITLAAGAGLLLPAAIMAAPNGKDSLREGYERFVGEPFEYFYSRPLGEF